MKSKLSLDTVGSYLATVTRGDVQERTTAYVEGILKSRLDVVANCFEVPNIKADSTAVARCTAKSNLCGKVCVPKTKKCKTRGRKSFADVIKHHEDRIRNLPLERAVVISKNGSVIVNKGGDQTSVSFTGAEMDRFKGAVVTHNHPNLGWSKDDERSRGLSFSKSDIECAATGEVSQMRAVSSGYTHTIDPPVGGWNKGYWNKSIKPVYEKHERSVYNEFTRKIITGRMKLTSGEAEYHHEVIRRTSDELKLNYQRRAA